MVSCGSGNEIVFWDFNNMKVLEKKRANAWITYNAKFLYGTTYVATGASNGQLRFYNTFSYNVSAETPALKTWSRATGFNWQNETYRDIIYQGYEDGIIREWKFDRKTKKFKLGYDEWCHLDAIRDIITLPEYDLMISTSRVNIEFSPSINLQIERRLKDMEPNNKGLLLPPNTSRRRCCLSYIQSRSQIASSCNCFLGLIDKYLQASGEVVPSR